MSVKRFRIALSFAGEKRDFVESVADILSTQFGKERILYDKYHEAEFARYDLGIHLPSLYREQSDLIVPVLCPNYDEKRWTGWEWVHIYSLLTKVDGQRVMPCRFEYATAGGLSPASGFIELDYKTPKQAAVLILERLALNEGNPRDYYTRGLTESEDDRPLENDQVSTVFFNVPYNSKGAEYVGRKGMDEEIWSLLTTDGCASIGQAVSVKGFGGLGKTQLAVEYTYAFKDRYKDGIFWIIADQPIEPQLLQIAEARGWINAIDNRSGLVEQVRRQLVSLEKALIVFDNVESVTDIEGFLPDVPSKIHILITSRERQPRFRQIDLDLLNGDESRELLLKISLRDVVSPNEKDGLDEILHTLGGIPLAIELVGGYLNQHQTITFTKYATFLREVPLTELENKFSRDSFTLHDHSIIRTLRVSEKTVKESPLMVELLKILSWSGSSSMGTSLLRTLTGSVDDFRFENALSEALALRLIHQDENRDRYSIHRLIAKVIRHENPFEQNPSWFADLTTRIAEWFWPKANVFDFAEGFAEEFDHLVEWQRFATQFFRSKSILLTHLRGAFMLYYGFFYEGRDFTQQAIDIYEQEGDNNPDVFGGMLCSLAMSYRNTGDFDEALKYQLKALKIIKEVYPVEHPDVAIAESNLGLIYMDLGKLKEALNRQQEALRIRETILELVRNEPSLPSENVNIINDELSGSLTNLGLTYNEMQDYQTGLEYHLRALKISKELHQKPNASTLNILNNIGHSYEGLGNFEKALEYHSQTLEMGREFYQSDLNDEIATSLGNLATTYAGLGEMQKSIDHQRQALKIREMIFRGKHADIGLSLHNLAISYLHLGEFETGLDFLKRSLEMYRATIGEKHNTTIRCAVDYVLALVTQGRAEQAGRLAAEFVRYVPSNNPLRQIFEIHGSKYRKARHRKKTRKN